MKKPCPPLCNKSCTLLALCAFILLPLSFAPFQTSASEYVLPENALKDFLRLRQEDRDAWVGRHQGKPLTLDNGEWKPQHRFYVVYRALQLRYWFEVPESEQGNYLTQLRQMVENPFFDKARDQVVVYSFTFEPGKGIKEGDLIRDGILADGMKDDKQGLQRFGEWAERKMGDIGKMPGEPSDEEGLERDSITAGETGDELERRLAGLMANREIGEAMQKLRSEYLKKVGLPSGGKGQSGDDNQAQPPQGEPSSGQGGGKDKATASDGGKKSGGGGGGGPSGPFPMKVSFSKWFVTMLDIVAQYFGIKEISMQILAVAYMIAPEIFEYVGEFMVKLQHAVTPNSLDDMLNKINDVVQHIRKFIKYAEAAYSLLKDPNLLKIVEKVDWKDFDLEKTIRGGEKLGLIPPHVLRKMEQFFPMTKGKILSDPEQLKRSLIDYGIGKAKEQARKIPGIGERINWDGLESCARQRDKTACENYMKDQMKSAAKQSLPGDWKRFGGAVDAAFEGNVKGMGREALLEEFKYRTGISVGDAKRLYELAEKKDWENFIKESAKTQLHRLRPDCRKAAEQVLNGQPHSKEQLWDISRCILTQTGNTELANKIETYGSLTYYAAAKSDELALQLKTALRNAQIPEDAIRRLLEGSTDDALRVMARSFGFTAPSAIESFVAGDLNRAVEEQTKHGLVRRDQKYYEELGRQIRQNTYNRLQLAKILTDALRRGDIHTPYNQGKIEAGFLKKSLK